MPTLTATFETRREAELAVEKLVQEYRLDRKTIRVGPEGGKNSAGEQSAGSDHDAGDPSPPARDDAALEGRIVVSADVPEDQLDRARVALGGSAAGG